MYVCVCVCIYVLGGFYDNCHVASGHTDLLNVTHLKCLNSAVSLTAQFCIRMIPQSIQYVKLLIQSLLPIF